MVGRYRFRSHCPIQLVRLADGQASNLACVRKVAEHDQALFLPPNQVPKSLKAPFRAAGEDIEKDFARFSLVALPVITESRLVEANGHKNLMDIPIVGFAFPSLEDPQGEVARFLAGAPEELRTAARSTICLTPFAENGKVIPLQVLHWNLFGLVGLAQADLKASRYGVKLNQDGRAAFSLLYQWEIIDRLITRGFGEEKYRGGNSFYRAGLSAQQKTAMQILGNQGQDRAREVLELFRTTDKP